MEHVTELPSFLRLNTIPLYVLTTSDIHSSVRGHTDGFYVSYCEYCFSGHGCTIICSGLCFQFFGVYARSETDGSYGYCIFKFLRNHHAFFRKGCTIFHFRLTVHRSSYFSTSVPAPVVFCFSDSRHPHECEVVSHCSLGLHFSNY